MSSLTAISAPLNQFTGSLPPNMFNTLSNLQDLSIMQNQLSAIYLMRKRNKKPSSDSPTTDQLAMISYQDLYQATDGFSAKNMIGFGGFGSVYKGNLIKEDKVIAIKETSTIGVKGTVGYAPPEYGMDSEVSTHERLFLTDKIIEISRSSSSLVVQAEISFCSNFLQVQLESNHKSSPKIFV
ncbi:non-specific serine/threonine protein kinase [Trifolium repens]|nr:non-specific serine/threonine protein kinase [Trifolium repens]